MKDEGCAAYRREISDNLGRGEALSAPCAAHLETCRECSAYAGLVSALAAGPKRTERSQEPDWRTAEEALGRATKILARRKETRHFALFLLLAASAMAAWAWLGIAGQGRSLLALQALAFLVLPFACLVALRGKTQGAST